MSTGEVRFVVNKQMVPPGSAVGELEILAGGITAKDFITQNSLSCRVSEPGNDSDPRLGACPQDPGHGAGSSLLLPARTTGRASRLHSLLQDALVTGRSSCTQSSDGLPAPELCTSPGPRRDPGSLKPHALAPSRRRLELLTWDDHIVTQTGALFGVKGTTIHHANNTGTVCSIPGREGQLVTPALGQPAPQP